MEKLETIVDPTHFFRANRKFLIHADAIEHAAGFLKSPPVKQTILYEVKKIKEIIESKIGLLE